MKKLHLVKVGFSIALLTHSLNAHSSSTTDRAGIQRIQQSATWMLPSYLSMAEQNPEQLLNIIEEEFKSENLQAAQQSPDKIFAWQDRTAYLGALTQFYNPEAKINGSSSQIKTYQTRAHKLITQALLEDASLLVRDAAVESIRRINRMRPQNSKQWKSDLENAFVSRKNLIDGEGLFIRETILNALREGSLSLSQSIRRSAELDQNSKVRDLVKLWSTQAFDTL